MIEELAGPAPEGWRYVLLGELVRDGIQGGRSVVNSTLPTMWNPVFR